MAVANTSDGASISGAMIVLDHASVPDGVRMADGSIAIYYVDGSAGGVHFGHLTGSVFTPVGPISVNGVSGPRGVVDPDVSLVDGRVRLVYLSGFGTTGQRAYCIAESSDGQNFQVVSAALTLRIEHDLHRPVDGPVSRMARWLLAGSNGQSTILARSTDGLSFSQYGSVNYGGVPEVALTSDNRVRLYVCGSDGIDSYLSGDSGSTWTSEATVVPAGTLGMTVCDPSYVAGANLFVFKTAG